MAAGRITARRRRLAECASGPVRPSRLVREAVEYPWLRPGQFSGLHGIETDKAGRIYVADRSNHRIQIFDAAGTLLDSGRTCGSRITRRRDGSDVWVADGTNARLLKFDPQGKLLDRRACTASSPAPGGSSISSPSTPTATSTGPTASTAARRSSGHARARRSR